MFNLGKITLAITLAAIMTTGTAIAGETSSPPCPPPSIGETSSPPCSSSQFVTDDEGNASAVSGELETVIFEAAAYAAESLLTLF